eukprot:CAMPEP_0195507440 /NCGR_PEP_ID=MMETSP0794_2-20130614/894_1 /TAXON_ID=515487 /ORGANISM="Stephanopyxis turris, Strain CCMP 815" /LENGTH=268 /DNA_ID=CAMNT_0040634123 /DNA_START=158 /DNA_END=964 /DNA_ORIENTATION=+
MSKGATNTIETNSLSAEESGSLLVSTFSLGGTEANRPTRLILASQSPRRSEILDMMGLQNQYLAVPSPLDESALQRELADVPPVEYTELLARHKAQALGLALLDKNEEIQRKISHEEQKKGISNGEQYLKGNCDVLVVGSDTIVDLDGSILEKPQDQSEAMDMLGRLSGRWHKVHTGVAIYSSSNNFEEPAYAFTETADVRFANLSSCDIAAYVATGEPMDKAGSYGIQGVGGQLVKSIKGDFFAVMGLPMHRFSRELTAVMQRVKKS